VNRVEQKIEKSSDQIYIPDFDTGHNYFCNFGAFKTIMRKYISGVHFIIIAGLSLFLFSCTPQPCQENTVAYVHASLYDKATEGLRAPDSLTMWGIGVDTTKLYDKAPNIQPALMPLDASTGNCVFVVRINGVTDTVKFWYNSFPHLVSKECGYTFYHAIDSLAFTTNKIDTILIINSRITLINEEYIRIFY
jgi:hypothetical protein